MITTITRSYHEDGKIISQTNHTAFYWDGTFEGLKRLEEWLAENNPRNLGTNEIHLEPSDGDVGVCGIFIRYTDIVDYLNYKFAELTPECYVYVDSFTVHTIPNNRKQTSVPGGNTTPGDVDTVPGTMGAGSTAELVEEGIPATHVITNVSGSSGVLGVFDIP